MRLACYRMATESSAEVLRGDLRRRSDFQLTYNCMNIKYISLSILIVKYHIERLICLKDFKNLLVFKLIINFNNNNLANLAFLFSLFILF